MTTSAVRYAIEQRTGLDPTNLPDAEYIVQHPDDFDADELRLAQANIDAAEEDIPT